MKSPRRPAHPVLLPVPDITPWRASATGTPWVHEFASAAPGPEVLITALVHGNEFSGALALAELLRSGLRPRRGRLTLAFCNVAAFQRFDASCPDASRCVDEDFNRVWSQDRLASPATDGESTELRRARAASIRGTRDLFAGPALNA